MRRGRAALVSAASGVALLCLAPSSLFSSDDDAAALSLPPPSSLPHPAATTTAAVTATSPPGTAPVPVPLRQPRTCTAASERPASAVPQIDCARRGGDGFYSSRSLPHAVLDVSSDQFVYRYKKNRAWMGMEKGYGVDFPSAWIMTRDEFLRVVHVSSWLKPWPDYIEANVFYPLGFEDVKDGKVRNTLDFFDFFGAHLSFWADAAGLRSATESTDMGRQGLRAYLEERLGSDIAGFQRLAAARKLGRAPLRRGTVALLPYSSGRDASVAGSTAFLMANATFWSLQSQFDAVVVGACRSQDLALVARLPAWRVLNLSGARCGNNSGMYLLDHAMKALRGDLDDSPAWANFKYIYFTEGDVLLYMRQHEHIEEHLRSWRRLRPHRLDVLPVFQDLPESLQTLIADEDPHLAKKLLNTSASVIDAALDNSSCCFAGRMKSCAENWWTCSSTFPFLEAVKFRSDSLPLTLGTHGGPEFCHVVPRAGGRRAPCR